jgi:hypothetical protein
MGIRGEVFSTKVILQNRTYFFNVKENRLGDLYLNIVESKNRDTGGFDRQSVILFADDLTEFLQGFDESLKVLEKAVKEKRRAAPRKAPSEARGDGEGRESRPPRKTSPASGGARSNGERSDGSPAKRFRSKQDRPDAPASRGRKETGKATGRAPGKPGPRKPGSPGADFSRTDSRKAPRGRMVVRKRDRDE